MAPLFNLAGREHIQAVEAAAQITLQNDFPVPTTKLVRVYDVHFHTFGQSVVRSSIPLGFAG